MTFAEISAVRPGGRPGCFTAVLDPRWSVAGKPHGGYLLATVGRAAADVSGRADVLSASAVFLHAPDPGLAHLEVELLRSGRSVSHARARLSQGGVGCVEALVLLGELDGEVFWDGGVPAPEVAPFERCVRMPAVARDGTALDVMGLNDLRIDPDTAGFLRGEPRGAGELRGWIGLAGAEPFDSFSLLYAVDSMPPATIDVQPAGWVPTLELTAYVRGRPAPGPVRVLQRAQLVADGRVDETCLVWDAAGRLVAQATQLAGLRTPPGARGPRAARRSAPPGRIGRGAKGDRR